MSNIIDKIQVSGVTYGIQGSGGTQTIELTQAEYDALVDKDPNTFYVITDAQAGDLTNYYTKSETNTLLGGKADTATTYTKTEVDTALASKQTTLTAGTNITIVDNVISATGGGGGKAIEAGRGIAITTGETADTVSFNLPISAGTGTDSIIEGIGTTATSQCSHAEGWYTLASGFASHAEGANTQAVGSQSHVEGGGSIANGFMSHAEGWYATTNGNYSHAEGYSTANGEYSHTEGFSTTTTNQFEHASGRYNLSSSASITFGDSGNTLFSVGNGTENAMHNAFEIRQNGDIYLSSGGTDIKLQDYLGGGGGGGVNVVQTTGTSTTDVMSQDAVTTQLNNKADKSTAGGGLGTSSTNNYDILYLSNQNGQKIDGYYKQVSFSKINGKHIISQGSFNPNSFSLVEASAITTSVTSSSTDAQVPSAKAVNDKLGGLSLVKLTQAEYDALATKDNSTLYVIVN